MPDKTDIERVHKIDDVNVSTPIDLDNDLTNKKVKGENKGMYYYAVPKESRLERLFDALLETIAGENKAGKIIGKGKDVLSYFVPAGRELDEFTDAIGDQLKSKRTNNTMENPTTSKKKSQSKTWWGIITTVLGTLLGAIGIAADPSFLADGFQPMADLEMAIAFMITVAGWAVKNWGLRTAEKKIR